MAIDTFLFTLSRQSDMLDIDRMRYINFVLLFTLALSACTANKGVPAEIKEMQTTGNRPHLQFLTRDGCKNTPVMLSNLKEAISEGKIAADYTVVHQGSLPPEDPRGGYPTPTILLNGKDIFGLGVPRPPFPEPS